MKSNIQHINALTTQLLSDAKDYFYRTGEQIPAAEHFSNAIALCEFAQYEVDHADILHAITMVDWAIEELENRTLMYDIDMDAMAAEYEADLPAEDIPF